MAILNRKCNDVSSPPPPQKCTKFLKQLNIYWFEECVHLGCDVTSPCKRLPAVRRNIRPSSARVWVPRRIHFSRTFIFEEAVQSFETSGTDYPVTSCHISEKWFCLPHCLENFKIRQFQLLKGNSAPRICKECHS